ncbi:MAG: sigma-70 domain-containing protein [Candidatus Bipolaricaulota bacterium]
MAYEPLDPWEAEVEQLLQKARAGTEAERAAARNEATRLATPFVDQIVQEAFSTSGYSRGELIRPGYLGLLNAVANYDLSRGQPFRSYAENLIKGEIRAHIRERAERGTPPRWMADLNGQLDRAQARLLRELGRVPTLAELADAVNITEEGVSEILQARESLRYVSLDAGQRRNDPVPTMDVSKIRSIRATPFPIEYRIRIAAALEKLAELQQALFRRLFGGGDEGE